MRDPNRIKPFLARIEQLWLKNTDLRFGQFMIWLAKIEEYNPKLSIWKMKHFQKKLRNGKSS